MRAVSAFCNALLSLQVQKCIMKVCSHRVSHVTNLCLLSGFLVLSPLQALHAHIEKAGCSQGAGQRAEFAVYSRQNTGGWINLLFAMAVTSSVVTHLIAACHGL